MSAPGETFLSALFTHAATSPESPAFVQNDVIVSYRHLAGHAARGAEFLSAAGVAAGDMLAIDLTRESGDAVRSLALVYACAWLGAILLPLYPGVPDQRRNEILTHLKPRWLVTGTSLRDALRIARLDPAGLDLGVVAVRTVPRADEPTRPFEIDFSSGTTGIPKAVLYTQGQLARRAQSITGCFGWTADDRLLPPKRWPSGPGLRWIWRAHRCGATLVNAAFPQTRAALIDLVARFGVTGVGASPWQVRRWLARDPMVQPLKFLEITGAPATPAEIHAIRQSITPHTWICYGTTEAGATGVHRPSDASDAAFELIDGAQGEVVGDDDRPLPAGVEGQLRFRSLWMAQGYFDNEAASQKQFRNGWFYPADRGVMTGSGRFLVRGRTDDVINHGGNKIVPIDIESVLLAQSQVVDAAVVGVPDPMAGERAVACLVIRDRSALGEVLEAMRAQIMVPSRPSTIVLIAAIPRNQNGKVLREVLREQVIEMLENSAHAQRSKPRGSGRADREEAT